MEAIPSLEEARQLYNNNKRVFRFMEYVVYDARKQDYEGVNLNLKNVIRFLDEWMKEVIRFGVVFAGEVCFPDMNSISVTINQLLETQNQRDFVLLADYLEFSLKPILNQVFECLRNCYEDIFFEPLDLREIPGCLSAQEQTLMELEAYPLEETSSGFATLALQDDKGTYYLHSNGNPMLEARTIAEQYYKPELEQYLIYGVGLGYHITELLWMGDDIEITVYECDIRMIRTVLPYWGWQRYFASGRLTIVYDPDLSKFVHALDEAKRQGVMIHAPSIRNCHVAKRQEALRLYFAKESALHKCAPVMTANFYRNQKNCVGYVDELKAEFEGKTVIIVAAGPSYSKNAEQLRNLPKDTVILAVTTIYKKMLAMGIYPDYVIHSDAQKKTYNHLVGIQEDINIPMLVLSTAYEAIARCYSGPAYLVCQKDYDLAENYAKEHKLSCYETGGSVATLALSVAVGLNAKRVIFVGLDLAYTDGLAHAKGVSGQMPGDMEAVKVPGYYGGVVSSSLIFADFIRWFSDYLKGLEPNRCEVINATEGGAKIEGMKQMPLAEALAADTLII